MASPKYIQISFQDLIFPKQITCMMYSNHNFHWLLASQVGTVPGGNLCPVIKQSCTWVIITVAQISELLQILNNGVSIANLGLCKSMLHNGKYTDHAD